MKDNYKKYSTVVMEISEWKKREKTEKNIWNNNEWEVFKINDRCQTIDPEIREDQVGDI